MDRVTMLGRGMALAIAISLSAAAPAGTSAPPPLEPAAEGNLLDEGSALSGQGPVSIILGLILGAAILYGIYDVLIQSDSQDVPASP